MLILIIIIRDLKFFLTQVKLKRNETNQRVKNLKD